MRVKSETAAGYLPERLKELRRARDLTQDALALATSGSVGVSCIREIEQGNVRPRWDTVVALCRALKVGPDALVCKPGSRRAKRLGRPRKEEARTPEAPCPAN